MTTNNDRSASFSRVASQSMSRNGTRLLVQIAGSQPTICAALATCRVRRFAKAAESNRTGLTSAISGQFAWSLGWRWLPDDGLRTPFGHTLGHTQKIAVRDFHPARRLGRGSRSARRRGAAAEGVEAAARFADHTHKAPTQFVGAWPARRSIHRAAALELYAIDCGLIGALIARVERWRRAQSIARGSRAVRVDWPRHPDRHGGAAQHLTNALQRFV